MAQNNIKGLSREELYAFVETIGEKSFRAKQLWAWIYEKGAISFSEMTNLSKALREKLTTIATIANLKKKKTAISPDTATQKFIWELGDGLSTESVYIPEGKRRTICISTQVGCRLKCAFCATGTMGCRRNLEAWEIIDQVLSIRRELMEKPTNLVVMGMGEPFHNYDNVIKALTIINDPEGLAVSHRKITLSTAGVLPQFDRYTREGHPFKLAISLNATTNAVRSQLMPINKKYPIESVLRAARQYTRTSRKRITFEYVLLKGINDTSEDAQRLLRLLKGIPCKVNLTAYNAVSHRYARPSDTHIHAFAESIRPLSAPVTLRLSRGDDIQAACGQLASKEPILKKVNTRT